MDFPRGIDALSVVQKAIIWPDFNRSLVWLLLMYCAWVCMATYSWSEVPQLSIEKAVAFSLVAVETGNSAVSGES